MHLSSPPHIYRTLVERLSLPGTGGKLEDRLSQELVRPGQMVLLVLDEVDRLAEGGGGATGALLPLLLALPPLLQTGPHRGR